MSKVKLSEEELISLLKLKDKVAFSYLYDNYSAALYGIVLRILKQDEKASQDVLQEAFIKIWKKIESYDEFKGTLFTWMLNITRNTAIDALRSINRHPIQSISDDVNIYDREHFYEMGEDKIGIKDTLSNLREEYKIIIQMAYFGGFTQEEISQKLEMPLGTVKTRTRAALSELRKYLS